MQSTLKVNGVYCKTVLINRLWNIIIEGKAFILYNGWVKNKKRIGGRAFGLRLKGICEVCGQEFFGLLSDNRRCCSRSCSGKIGIRKTHTILDVNSESKSKKLRANEFINYLVRKKRIIPPKVCSNCGLHGIIDAHHPCYDKPNEVVWLCRSCHKKLVYGHKIEGKLITYALQQTQGAILCQIQIG